MINVSKVIKHQVISEKATALEKEGKYLFAVSPKTTKRELKSSIEKVFKAKVKKINILRVKGKVKKLPRYRRTVKKPDWKKAVITLEEGEKLKLLSPKGGKK